MLKIQRAWSNLKLKNLRYSKWATVDKLKPGYTTKRCRRMDSCLLLFYRKFNNFVIEGKRLFLIVHVKLLDLFYIHVMFLLKSSLVPQLLTENNINNTTRMLLLLSVNRCL